MTDIALPPKQPSTTFVIALAGEIDVARVPELQEFVEEFRRNPAVDVVVDLRQVDFMDSTGLGMMTRLSRVAVERGGSISVIHASPNVDRTIRISGLSQVLNLRTAD